MFSADALRSLTEPLPEAPARSTLSHLARRLTQHGWRHVAAPGLAMAWDPRDRGDLEDTAGWTSASVESLVGPANVGLEAHRSWGSAQLDGLTVVVDGACLDHNPFTGTQHLVVEISRWLSRTRANARILLAVKPRVIDAARDAIADADVQVVGRTRGVDADVVYRPYQMLYANELDFVLRTGRRGLVGQLDMIGFSNPFYHPSDQLFFFARNMQRHLMRSLDGVTFISEFGRDSAFAECPDIDPARLHVVSCGADPQALPGVHRSGRPVGPGTPFLLCLASTFWHKNRAHAISTFAELARHHGYEGHLVLGGPEPFYGRSLDAEDDLLATLPDAISARVHRYGHVHDEEKWWLLRHADAVLYPSIVEGFGLVPFEAAAVDTPCLVHAGTAPGELLGESPAAVQSWAPSVWAARLAELSSSAEARRALVVGVQHVAAAHTWERCAERTWHAIEHALAAPRRSLHADDGGRLVRIAPAASDAPGTTLRFDLARGIPGIRRRLRAATAAVRAGGTS
jgi:glycosyltransferase involved in cell wall biosynthesis